MSTSDDEREISLEMGEGCEISLEIGEDDGCEFSPDVGTGDGCLCPSEVTKEDESPYQFRTVDTQGTQGTSDTQRLKGVAVKVDPIFKYECKGDGTGEDARTVAHYTERYAYRSPMDLKEDSGDSIGQLEGDYDAAVIDRNIRELEEEEVTVDEVIEDANWGRGYPVNLEPQDFAAVRNRVRGRGPCPCRAHGRRRHPPWCINERRKQYF